MNQAPKRLIAIFCFAFFSSTLGAKSRDPLRLNQLQMKGTHNSYHTASPLIPWRILGHSHEPIQVQLSEQGVRHLELDIHACGKNEFCVYHIGFLDARTTCETLHDCLTEIRSWSLKNQAHHPIFILIEPKDGSRTTKRHAYFRTLQNSILSVFSPEDIVLPQDVMGHFSTLREAVVKNGWPKINDIRGKVLFVLLDDEKHRDNFDLEIPSIKDRVMFSLSSKDRHDAAIIRLDNPNSSQKEITELVRSGFIVRTRADAGLYDLRANDFSRLLNALQSGAQLISTDVPQKVAGYDYFVEIPEGTPSRCNPISAPLGCQSFDVEYLY